MRDEKRVWVDTRTGRDGKTRYMLRWYGADGKAKCRSIGTDASLVEGKRYKLQDEISRGQHVDTKRITWAAFAAEHVATISGADYRAGVERSLKDFAEKCNIKRLDGVRFGTLERYRAILRDKGNRPATINGAFRNLRTAFLAGVRRGYLVKSPMIGWKFERFERRVPHILTADEEDVMLTSAKAVGGTQWRAFLVTALGTGGRCGELAGLTWANVDFDEAAVTFVNTKGKVARRVPINPDVIDVLRKLQVQTLREGGPFVGMDKDGTRRLWLATVAHSHIEGRLTLHDLRRCYVTRLIRAGVPLPTVQKLAGHADVKTTLDYYNVVGDADLRAGVDKLRKAKVS